MGKEKQALFEALELERDEKLKSGLGKLEVDKWYNLERAKIEKASSIASAELEARILEERGESTKAALKSLEVERDKSIAEGTPKAKADELYEAKRIKLLDELKDKAISTEIEILNAKEDGLSAALNQIKLERDQSIRANEDKLQAERLYQAKKAKLEKDYAKKRQDAELDLQQKTIDNEKAAGKDSSKLREEELKIQNQAKYEAIRRQVEAARKAGVDEVNIQRYITSEQQRIKKEAEKSNSDKSSRTGGSASPLLSAEDALKGLGINFSLDTTARAGGTDPAAVKAASKLAGDLNTLRNPSGKVESPDNSTTFTIRLVDGENNEIRTEVVKSTGPDQNFTQDYKLDGF